ncbi:hypothetical protein [Actinoplanes subtropicus]|uniref:hypothetical protein n=1 Tax=Actinoplanes subtropicus TaxID=543632 RepID=UPI0004C2EAE7|nr:hypothetical protein [Actinoplanes subtropicus]
MHTNCPNSDTRPRKAVRFRRRAVLAIGAASALMVAAVVQAAGMTPAAATTIPVGSIKVVEVASGFSAGASKTVTAACPASNPRVLGGGFTVVGTHIVVTQLQPITGTTDSYRVSAQFDQVGTSATWQLLAFAYCSTAAPGWQLVTAVTPTNSDTFKTASASCPGGKQVIGTGGRIDGGAGQVQLVSQSQGSFPSRMDAGGIEDVDGFAGSWSATAFAICVTTNNFTDVEQVTDQTAIDNTVTKKVTVTCPSGYRLASSAIWADVPGNAINLQPNNITPTFLTGTAHNDTDTTSAWDVIVYGICAR